MKKLQRKLRFILQYHCIYYIAYIAQNIFISRAFFLFEDLCLLIECFSFSKIYLYRSSVFSGCQHSIFLIPWLVLIRRFILIGQVFFLVARIVHFLFPGWENPNSSALLVRLLLSTTSAHFICA